MNMNAVSLVELGYDALVSVIPPGAPLSPGSNIAPESRGKAPGIRFSTGWAGYNWTERTLPPARIDADAANIGLRAAQFPGVDIDVKDADLAAMLGGVVEEIAPGSVARVGAPPKRLYPFRLEGEPFTRRRLTFQYQGERAAVEILANGQQYLIAGTHPSGNAYQWLSPLPPAKDLPALSESSADEILHRMADLVEMLGGEVDRHDTAQLRAAAIDQAALRAPSIDELDAVVRAIPNTEAYYPERDDYIRIGAAIRAAADADVERGFAIWREWALEWPENTEELLLKDWRGLHPPFAIGWAYLVEQAKLHGYAAPVDEFTADLGLAPELIPFSDQWLVSRLVEQQGASLRYVREWKRWFHFDATWRDDGAAVADIVSAMLNECAADASRRGTTKTDIRRWKTVAERLASGRQHAALLSLAAAGSAFSLSASDLDPHPHLMGTPEGVIDLRTGAVAEPDPAALVTKRTQVAPARMETPRWFTFLKESAGGDSYLMSYLQRVAGYCLTGWTREQCFFFLWGEGANGKSTFVETLRWLYGDYARTSQMETFTAADAQRHPTELAALAGARMVCAQETRQGRAWDEARIKNLTGGDQITARFLFQDEFSFVPAFKLVFAGNHRPSLVSANVAMRRRVHMVPFTHTPAKLDPLLGEKLREEAQGILQWAVDGAVLWHQRGLDPPAAVLDSTEQYFSDEADPFKQWIDSCCHRGGEGSVTAAALYDSWVRWCEQNNEAPGSRKAFGSRLGDLNLQRKHTAAGTVYQQIALVGEFVSEVQQ